LDLVLQEGYKSPLSVTIPASIEFFVTSMTTIALILAVLSLSTTPVFAQDLPVSESAPVTEAQNLSPVSLDLGTRNEYPVCNRMKNGVIKQKLQTATAE
jgi:hypothetical protein